MTEFAKRVAYFRRLHGVSQSMLAKELGVTPAAVCRWEAGVTRPRHHNMERLAEFLGMEVWAFLRAEIPGDDTPLGAG